MSRSQLKNADPACMHIFGGHDENHIEENNCLLRNTPKNWSRRIKTIMSSLLRLFTSIYPHRNSSNKKSESWCTRLTYMARAGRSCETLTLCAAGRTVEAVPCRTNRSSCYRMPCAPRRTAACSCYGQRTADGETLCAFSSH